MSFSFSTYIAIARDKWVDEQTNSSESAPGAVLRWQEKCPNWRAPQREALKTHMWLKFEGGNLTLADIVIGGKLTEQHRHEDNEHLSPTRQFMAAFAESKEHLFKLERKARTEKRKDGEWEHDLRQLLKDFPYPCRTYSLPMGAGKTYLMAAFICMDLHFSRLFPEDKRFAHNFLVSAPHGAKTAILPSLKTIANFDPAWALPEKDADLVRQEMRVEILDLTKSNNGSTSINNPNLGKVNLLRRIRERGMVFVTNAEKLVLERYSNNSDRILVAKGAKERDEVQKHNELRDNLAEIPALAVFLDEVHHVYSKSGSAPKKLRDAIALLNAHGNLREVNGFSGTPYISTRVKVADVNVNLATWPDVVYDFPLAQGIGVFLKTPKVVKHDNVRDSMFISAALDEFFNKKSPYDVKYNTGAKSKMAIYSASIEDLNKKILPEVKAWYARNKPGKEREIFSYYVGTGNGKGASKEYALPSGALAEFHQLDSPDSDKRVILLVAVGKEGWDCRSLAAVVLPRSTTTPNFVLQTSCRCLREVEDASKEKALIYLGSGNYNILATELKKQHGTSVEKFETGNNDSVPVTVLKPKLGTLRYKDSVSSRWVVEIAHASESPAALLEKINMRDFAESNEGEAPIKLEGSITSDGTLSGLTPVNQENDRKKHVEEFPLDTFSMFLTELQHAVYGMLTAADMETEHGNDLLRIYEEMLANQEWFAAHPAGCEEACHMMLRSIAACFAESCEYRSEEVTNDVEINLLEWYNDSNFMKWGSGIFLPTLQRNELDEIRQYPKRIEEKLQRSEVDQMNISFNYAPYRMDSKFEECAIVSMLQQIELKGLELYYNGLKHPSLKRFIVQTPAGRYTPDFLLLRRCPVQGKKGQPAPIDGVLMIETKSKRFYDDAFKAKEEFIKGRFGQNNPNFHYILFLDRDGRNNFDIHLKHLRKKLIEFIHAP